MLGQRQPLPPSSTWTHTARQFYFWDGRRTRWEIIGTHVEPCPGHPACLATFGNPRADLQEHIGSASLYEERWIANVNWVYSGGRWYFVDSITYGPGP